MKMKSTSSVKPAHGGYGGHFNSTPSSDKQGGYGAPPGRRISGPFPRNPKQNNLMDKGTQAPYRNTVSSNGPGNMGGMSKNPGNHGKGY